MKKVFRLIMLVSLLVMAVAPLSVSAQGGLEDGTFTIAWIPKSLNNPVFELGRDGCFAAAAELTAAGPYTVECLYLGSVASDMAEQARGHR
jgi:ribose transport system substrate-binding protein